MPSMPREKGQGTGPFPVTTPTGATHYRVAVTMPDGHRVWRTRPTWRAAERARRELVEARELDLDPTRQTLADYLRSWLGSLRDARNQRVRPRTLEHYTLVVERHIVPALGSLKLSAVTGRRVQAWLDADPGAPRTVRHHHAVLRRALNVAVRQRLLAYNPAAAVELPDVDVDVARPLSLDESRRLLDATRDDRLGPLWRLALVTGMRQGELLGLAWDDVEPGHVTVRAQLQRIGGTWVRTPPKAARRVTRIAIDVTTAEALEAHRRAMAAERTPNWEYHGLVFVTPQGRPYHGKDISTAFHAACEAAGIARRRVHDLRHTSATLLRELGVAEDARMARLGHNSVAMARNYSEQGTEKQDRAVADALARAIAQ